MRKGGRTERKGKGGRREGERKGRRKEVKRKEGRKEREWGEETKLLAVCKCMTALTSFLCDAGLVGNRSPSSGLVANKSLEPAEKKVIKEEVTQLAFNDHGSLVRRLLPE